MRSKGIQVVLAVSAIMAVCPFAWGKYGGGTGAAADPYLVYTAEHLQAMGENPGDWGYRVHYRLMADIDMATLGKPMQPIGNDNQWFYGVFDGNGKTLSNLKIEATSGDCVGLFGCAEVEVHNLRLVNVDVDAPRSTSVGALAGRLVGLGIEDCSVEGGRVSGLDEVGGLIGTASTVVTRCYTTCKVSGRNRVGGLLGRHTEHQVAGECYTTASVSGTSDVGGLVGANRGVLKDSYAMGDVYGRSQVGGLIGNSFGKGAIWNCYAAGRTKSEGTTGGLSASGVICYSCYWDVEATGQATSSRGVGKTTVQMRKAETFVGWGRSAAWTIDEGNDCPRLAWQGKPGVPLTTAAFPDIEGEGTAKNPYLIRTPEQLNAIGDHPGEWDRHYRLEADLDLATLHEPFHIVGYDQIYFTGTFDGGGHSIANFKCPGASYGVGMFGFTGGATIKRVTLIKPRAESAGSLSVGTLVGQQIEGIVDACASEDGFVSGMRYVGGLVGRCSNGTITRSYSTCTVEGYSLAEEIGGLVGTGVRCNINNCYALGDVSGLHWVGGLVGQMMDAGSVTQCYSAGRVTGLVDIWGVPDAGGLIGVVDRTFVEACFWDVQTSGFTTSAAGRGLPTAEMQKASTFILAGWDFWGETMNGRADIWSVEEGKDYPRLFRQPAVEPVLTYDDEFEDGVAAPLWQVYQPKPNTTRIQEISGRLEIDTPVPAGGASALYIGDWKLDSTKDFSLKIDFRFDANTAGEGWVSIGLTPSFASPTGQCIDVTAGSLDNQPNYAGRQVTAEGQQKWWAARGCDAGTLYISYDAKNDELYRSFTGFGPMNSWNTTTRLLAEQWAGKPLYVIIGGGTVGMELKPGTAWLDNFSLDAGTIVP